LGEKYSLALLIWNHECVVGVQAMDDQHAVIMDTMNELRQLIVQGGDRKLICDHIDRLIAFTQMHFQSEEQLLEQRGFPGIAEHRAVHQRLLSQVQSMLERARHSDAFEIEPFFQFLRNWYSEHIEGLDRQYGPWLNSRGVY
jgi:hemerythrin